MWVSIRQYAESHNVSPSSVYQRIANGSIATKIVKGIKMVNDDMNAVEQVVQQQNIEEDQNSSYQKRVEAKAKIENALKLQKLKNLRQDTILKKQKQTSTKQKYRQEYVQGVFECFTDSFSNVKNIFIELKLNKQQNQILKKSFAKAIKTFETKLKKYLAEKDRLEQKENETVVEVE